MPSCSSPSDGSVGVVLTIDTSIGSRAKAVSVKKTMNHVRPYVHPILYPIPGYYYCFYISPCRVFGMSQTIPGYDRQLRSNNLTVHSDLRTLPTCH